MPHSAQSGPELPLALSTPTLWLSLAVVLTILFITDLRAPQGCATRSRPSSLSSLSLAERTIPMLVRQLTQPARVASSEPQAAPTPDPNGINV